MLSEVEKAEETEANAKVTQAELEEACKGLQFEKSILSKLDAEIKATDFAGSTEVPQLVFLTMYTRFLDKPVSLLIKGPSGSGKSHALNAGIEFVPADASEIYHGMSEKALIYNADLNLRHRYLIIQEAAGLNKGDGRVFLRQLLSEGVVRYATVQATADGLIGKDLPPLEGPTGLIMTTTANELHPEDESRMLSIHIDESRERTQAILARIAAGGKKSRPKLDVTRWHALHNLIALGPLEVEIPYAEKLATGLPVDHFRIGRDFPQVLSLIKAHALMHKFTRERTADGAVIATAEDYSAVHTLVEKYLAEGLEAAVPDRIRTVVEAVSELIGSRKEPQAWGQPTVNQIEIAQKIGRHQSVASRNVAAAIESGYLTNETPGQGREASIGVGKKKLPNGRVLLPPADLAAELAAEEEVAELLAQ